MNDTCARMRPPVSRALGLRFVTSALLVVVASMAFAGQASAAPCWQRLMLDWYDGSIDKTYPIACYQQAIANMGEDLKNYSSARDDIRRALQAAIAAKAHTT